jgi:hypothetical protein
MTSIPRLYCVDTGAWISSFNRYYKPQSFPTIWDKVENLMAAGRLIISEEVIRETLAKDDGVAAWLFPRAKLASVATTVEVTQAVRALLEEYPKLVNDMKGRNRADTFVVAVAQLRSAVVITEEEGAGSSDRPKIPGICGSKGIECGTFSDLIVWEGWTFN